MAEQVHYEVRVEAPEIQVALGLQLEEATALAIPEEVHDCAKVEPCDGMLVVIEFTRNKIQEVASQISYRSTYGSKNSQNNENKGFTNNKLCTEEQRALARLISLDIGVLVDKRSALWSRHNSEN